jgi:hypothetical protein
VVYVRSGSFGIDELCSRVRFSDGVWSVLGSNSRMRGLWDSLLGSVLQGIWFFIVYRHRGEFFLSWSNRGIMRSTLLCCDKSARISWLVRFSSGASTSSLLDIRHVRVTGFRIQHG